MHGPALEQEALQTAVQDSVQKLLADNKLRPAMQPSVDLAEGYEAGKDAEVTVELEVLPEIPTPQIEGLKLERLMVEATGEEIEAALERIVSQQKSFEEAPKTHKAAFGDRSEEHTSELQSLMRISYAVFCLKQKNQPH